MCSVPSKTMSFQSEEGEEMSKLKQHDEEITTRQLTNEVSTEEEGQGADENDGHLHSNAAGDKRPRSDSIYSIPDITLPEYIKNSEDGNSGNVQEVKSNAQANRNRSFRLPRSSWYAFRRRSRCRSCEGVYFGSICSSTVPAI